MNKFSYFIPSREEILNFLRIEKNAQNITLITTALNVQVKEIKGLIRRLNAMERDGQIKRDQVGNYKLISTSNFIEGYVSGHRNGFGFLSTDNKNDIFLSKQEMQKVLHGDRVRVRVVSVTDNNKTQGIIIEVICRVNINIVGRLFNKNNVLVVVPEDKRICQNILLVDTPSEKIKIGNIVNVQILKQPSRYTQPVGKIIEILGDIDDPGIEIEIAVRKYSVPYKFSEAAIKQAKKLPNIVKLTEVKNRIDLREIPFVTIDSEDAHDFDDAVYCEQIYINHDKVYRLIIAISDVSHYVKPNDALDDVAFERSTSIYFPRRVIPMLPEKLSNDLCSLKPNVDRLTLVCDACVTLTGQIKTYKFYPAIINSVARLTYTEVAAILANTQGYEAFKKKKLIPHLLNLNNIFKILLNARYIRGAIDLDITETIITYNNTGKIEKILPIVRNDAHRLIEECMLVANVCAANMLTSYKQPILYRVHAAPTKEKLKNLRTFLKKIGLYLKNRDIPITADYAKLIPKIKLRPDSLLIQSMILRSMQQAVYSPNNIGHFGLSYKSYAHFTSPIRRYCDLLTHRAIKAILQGKNYEFSINDTGLLTTTLAATVSKIQTEDKINNKKQKKYNLAVWDALGIHCSKKERRAEEASRDVEAWLKCYFIRDKLGEKFSGTISGVTTFGIFVQLDVVYIEGMVHITELGTDSFHFNQERYELYGERTGIRYQLTDRVKVQINHVDLNSRKITLRLIDKEI